jgi:protein TonB
MITGFNTDVDHDGRTFHVQTEERGRDNPVVETLVYCGGQIITFESSSYSDLVESRRDDRDVVLGRMESQHGALIRRVLAGDFDELEPTDAEDDGTEDSRSLDEVVSAYLDDSQVLLDHVQQFLADQQEDEQEAATGARREDSRARARKLQRILARLESRVEEAAAAVATDVSAAGPPAVAAPEPAAAVRPRRATYAAARPVEPRREVNPPRRRRALHVGILLGALLLATALGAALLWRRPAAPAPLQPLAVDPIDPFPEPRPLLDVAPVVPEASPAPGARTPEPAAPPTARSEPRETARAAPRNDPPLSAPEEPARPQVAERRGPEAVPVATPEELAPSPAEVRPAPVEPEPLPPEPVESTAAPEPAAPAAPEIWAGKLVDASELTLQPRPIRRDLPHYTRRAKRRGDTGTVEVRVMVIENGKVAAVELVEGIPGSDLDEATVAAAGSWEFTPPYKYTYPVRTWIRVRLSFAIARGGKTLVKVES